MEQMMTQTAAVPDESTGTVAEEEEEQQLVVFMLNEESYGVDVSAVREIIRLQEITRVPRTPEFVEGVINLRGRIIPVVDLRKRFGFAAAEQTQESRIVVVDTVGQDVGMVVDAVTEVLRITGIAVEPPSSVMTQANADYLRGIVQLQERLIILLELGRVLSVAEQAALADTAAAAGAAT